MERSLGCGALIGLGLKELPRVLAVYPPIEILKILVTMGRRRTQTALVAGLRSWKVPGRLAAAQYIVVRE
jgi:hypothetical protein